LHQIKEQKKNIRHRKLKKDKTFTGVYRNSTAPIYEMSDEKQDGWASLS
jgi:hypothetical protein